MCPKCNRMGHMTRACSMTYTTYGGLRVDFYPSGRLRYVRRALRVCFVARIVGPTKGWTVLLASCVLPSADWVGCLCRGRYTVRAAVVPYTFRTYRAYDTSTSNVRAYTFRAYYTHIIHHIIRPYPFYFLRVQHIRIILRSMCAYTFPRIQHIHHTSVRTPRAQHTPVPSNVHTLSAHTTHTPHTYKFHAYNISYCKVTGQRHKSILLQVCLFR